MATCSGSGLNPTGSIWRDPNYTGGHETEGWRATCHECFRTVAVTPVGGRLIRHSNTLPKLSGKKRTEALYNITYELAKNGESIRPDNMWPRKDIEVWLMAYCDGVGDAGKDGRKIGALKRWLTANGLASYALDI